MKTGSNFYNLTPDAVLNALEDGGFEPTGRVIQLNSYENRVFDIELENKTRIIAKFYRPHRWSKSAIEEEHEFLKEIQLAGLKTAPALKLKNERTILEFEDIFWSAFPRIQGRLPQELLGYDLERVGRSLAIIHNVGAQKVAKNRPTLNVENYGKPALEILSTWVAREVWHRYSQASHKILATLEQRQSKISLLRIHGDCHRGNLLDSGSEFFFVDFDDFCNGPAAQDFWMLTAGDSEEQQINLNHILKGYEELREFNDKEFELFEPLRGLRMLHYSAWIAKRWSDPSFPKLFPEFNTYNYWSEETETLEKIAWSL